MKLNSFSTEIFAGINDRSLTFTEGLNVILGPNEAGKSTIVNALFAALFVEPKIKLNVTEGKEFKDRFLPYPAGDYVNGKLVFSVDDANYTIYKKWSREDPEGYLILPDGSRVEQQERINELQKELFSYGKSTYDHIVFTKQQEIKSTLQNITENNELIDTVSNFLRRAVMELDGVSIDRLKQKLEEELDDLTSKWSLESGRPANPARGVNHPYKVGTGKIYDAFIAREKLRHQIKEAERIEEEYQDLSAEINELKEREKQVKAEVDRLSGLEEDITDRERLELKVENLQEKIVEIKDVNKRWPVLENELERQKQELSELQSRLKELEAEKTRADKYKRKQELAEKLIEIDQLQEEIVSLQKERAEIGDISKGDVEKLAQYESRLESTKASLKAARLKAEINYSAGEEIKVTPGIEPERNVDKHNEIQADGYIRIKTDHIDIEIESAEIDFSSLQEEYQGIKRQYSHNLQELNVENVASAREKLSRLNQINNSLNLKQSQIEDILAGRKYKEIKAEQESYSDMEEARDLEKIEVELEQLKNDQIQKLKTDIQIKMSKLEEWEEKYDSYDNLVNKLVELNTEKAGLSRELEELVDLPDEYDSAVEFREELKQLRETREEVNNLLRTKLQKVHDLKNKLPESSTEELNKLFKEKAKALERDKERAAKIIKIKDVFENKLEQMDSDSFKPLVSTFSDYLNTLTAGKYAAGLIDDDFKIEIQREGTKKLPANMDILSYGTYDGVALALRFALFDNLFQDKGGFIVLDDCLVNLDPVRKANAINLINDFSEKYQLLFTTCSPATAAELGGNIIEL
ncbi:MAG: AAA family ATPase [Bacillota bacterium]